MRFPFRIKKAKRRLLSILIAVAIFADALPLNVFSGIISSPLTIEASAAEYTPTKQAAEFTGETISFAAMSEFLDYCYHYARTDGFAPQHQNDTLVIALTNDTENRGTIPESFVGLGTAANPFGGTVRFAGASVTLKAHRAIFNYVYDSVMLLDDGVTSYNSPVELKLVRLSNVGESESKPLLADHVVHKDGSTFQWNIVLDESSTGTYSGVIGELGAGAVVNLNFTNNSTAAIISNSADQSAADAGVICGVMNVGSVMNLSYTVLSKVTTYSVSSASGNAGGLVGTMNGTATLNISSYPTVSPSVTAANGYAGGLVGELTSDATITVTASVAPTESTETLTMVSEFDSLSGATVDSSAELTEQPAVDSSKAGDDFPAESSEVSEEPFADSSVDSSEEISEEATSVETETSSEEASSESKESTEELSVESSTDSSTEGTAESIVDPSDDSSAESFTVPLPTPSATPVSISGTVKGTNGAGGLFGHYTNKKNDNKFDLSGYQISTTVYGKYCGGVFGVLDNNMDSEQSPCVLTIKNTGNKGTISVSSASGDTTYDYTGYFGGIAGEYKTGVLTNSLVLDTLTITVAANSQFNAFGGAIGIVNSAAYVKANSVTVTARGTQRRTKVDTSKGCSNYAFFGGLVGATSSTQGVFLDVGNFGLTTKNPDNENSETFCGGGVVGQFYNGVLRLSGTTNMSNAKPYGDYATSSNDGMRYASYGQLVGTNDNVLVYALGKGNDANWKFLRSNGAISDDLGTWGEVVRIANIENDVLTFDSVNHTVTIKKASTTIGSVSDFVKTALNIQLNQGVNYDCLLFENNSESKRSSLLSGAITIAVDINLSGTGINGFMRDGCIIKKDNNNLVFGDVGTFTGTLKGNSSSTKVTLAIGESYGVYSTGQEGSGQIYRHQYNGLFSVAGDGTNIQNLTVGGTITVRNAGPDGMFIGGIAARVQGNISISFVTANEGISYHEGNNSDGTDVLGKNIGGYIGYVSGNAVIEIIGGCEASPRIILSGYHQRWNVYGGVIGKVASDSFSINIAQGDSDSLTVKMSSDVSGVTNVGTGSDGGGLIGYILSKGSYDNRIVNIRNLVFEDCTISNASSKRGGGFLGYFWLNTTAEINGVEIKGDSKIVNQSVVTDVGVMCHTATGKWTVDKLAISKMTMNDGASASLGMIVNRAYEEMKDANDKNKDGLYLNILNSGYSLSESNITLPETIGVFDEIAAYSAIDVLNGGSGAGVISIDMNSTREGSAVRITDTTGTYQNRISSKSANFANPNSRYYYNLNHIDVSDAGQNLLRWSVNNYAAEKIKKEFSALNDPLGTATGDIIVADLTGLSFYPVPDAGGSKIGNLNLSFNYESIKEIESAKGSDNFARDPAAQNQHYLMHSGLFMNLTEGSRLDINGKLTLSGNFLSVDKYNGALISDTMKGSLNCSGSIQLNGINPSSIESYLLINNIKRESTTSSALSLRLSNVSTGEGYTTAEGTTPKVAKSLIGTASGPGLSIEFSKIKLDARKENSISGATTGQITALDSAYKTKNSIFTDSTLLASIKTDDASVLAYNYTFAEDWGDGTPRNVTYGYEVSGSVEYDGKENQYYGNIRFNTNPLTKPDSNSGKFDFSTDFLKYVAANYDTKKDDNNLFSRELKVNVMTSALNKGCGTYNDPYIITDGKQLEAVSKYISGGSPTDLSAVNLPKKAGDYNSLSKNTTGARWCDSKTAHAEFVPNGDNYMAEDGTSWTKGNVQYYLANAYYKIGASFVVSDYLGLGGTSPNTAFRGVIVGETNTDGTPKFTITVSKGVPFINVSNGCVVKDINIVVNSDIELTQDSTGSAAAGFDYATKCQYYGGIIGEIMGGDNIIDNCYVTFNDGVDVTLKGSYGRICPVGSYVGVIVFGALIFKNMTAETVNKNANGLEVYYDNTSTNLVSDRGTIYVNPLVGRVINGYAVNETNNRFSVTEDGHYHDEKNTSRAGDQHSLKNSKKHYSIADINKTEKNKLNVSKVPSNTTDNGKIKIPNSQALFVLSLITQSLAGTADTEKGNYDKSLSYGTNTTVYGMSHNAEYTYVGTAETDSDRAKKDYLLASDDTAANSAIPYIIRHYTEKTKDITNTIIEKSYQNYSGTIDDLAGNSFRIYNTDGNTKYFGCEIDTETGNDPHKLKNVDNVEGATPWTFEFSSTGVYYLNTDIDNVKTYLCMDANGNMSFTNEKKDATKFTVSKDNNKFSLKSGSRWINKYGGKGSTGFAGWTANNNGSKHYLTREIISERTETIYGGYPSRCVTTTKGYYDIELTGTSDYILPDSFRGLGTVGFYDNKNDGTNKTEGYADRYKNRYCMKVDQFIGNNKVIDEDIYLNKYLDDNYFDVLHQNENVTQTVSSGVNAGVNSYSSFHGIGFFDSIVMKSDKSMLSGFTISGSVNTNVFKNDGTGAASGVDAKYLGLAVGGVVGWSLNGTWCNFYEIAMRDLSVRGACQVGGLLGCSGNKSTTLYINVTKCSAESLSLAMYATAQEIKSGTNMTNVRSGMGAFVGKVIEGGVQIFGTELKDKNLDLTKYSTVKISSYAPYDDLSVAAGGLVGYAGNGCQAYDMHVESQTSGNPITIGGSGVAKSGGIVGLMQPATQGNPDCVAKFINCEIKNVNIEAMHAGGLYGGTWSNAWSAYSIKIENCKMIGSDDTNKNTIKASDNMDVDLKTSVSYAGGFVGHGYVVSAAGDGANIEISNSKITNYNISSANVSGNSGAGGFIGYANAHGSNSIVCYIHDSSVEDCVIGADGNNAGGAIGNLAKNTANKLLGYNVKLKNVTSNSDNMGAWVGYMDNRDTATIIQFTGIAIYGKGFENGEGFEKNIGSWTPEKNNSNNNVSFVFADYDEKCADSTSGNTLISGLNYDSNTHVDMPKYPFVNINPQSSLGGVTDEQGNLVSTNEILTGDAAVLLPEGTEVTEELAQYPSKKTRAARIYSDILANTSKRRYTTVGKAILDGTNTVIEYMKRTAEDDGDRISTYEYETGSRPKGVDDFAVVVIANTNNAEATKLINDYIQLVTNTVTDYTAKNDYVNIEVKTCEYRDSGFVITTDTNKGLEWTSPTDSTAGSFALNGDYADSKKTNTFTLVDVQFKDPLHKDKIAYHLYVPVYTIKQIEVEFSVAVKTGTTSVSYSDGEASREYSALMESTGTHIDSLQTWITQYLRFTYSEEDINVLLSSGNVKWNHEKSVIFDTQNFSDTEIRLPNNTYMVLVDPNGNSDRQYYAQASDFDTYRNIANNKDGWKIDLAKFKRGEEEHFSVKSLAELIEPYLVVTANQGKGSYVNGTAEDYDAYKIDAGNGEVHYYKYTASKNGDYDLTVTQAINEDYYISMFVPKNEDYGNELYFYSIVAPAELPGVKVAKVKKINSYNVLVADLYTQETSSLIVSPDDQQISASNKKLAVKASTSIRINNPYARSHLNSTALFHSFNLSLNRYTEAGVSSEIDGLVESGVTAKYSLGTEANADSADVNKIDLQNNYLNIETAEIMSNLVQASANGAPLMISAYIEMDFDENKLEVEFPQKSSDSNIGVNVAATSNLSYDSSRLAFTSMTEAFAPDNHYYYRESVNSAILYYSAVSETDEYESYGKLSQNQSRLGVNGYCSDKTEMPINTVAKYNVSAISTDDLAYATNLRLSISLSKKTDILDSTNKVIGVEYKQVEDMRKYLNSGIEVTSGKKYKDTHSITDETKKTLVVDIPIESCEGDYDIFTFGIGFAAKTGESFNEYANYRVTVRAELLNNSGKTIQNSGASDYIIYTNAKVYPQVMSREK